MNFGFVFYRRAAVDVDALDVFISGYSPLCATVSVSNITPESVVISCQGQYWVRRAGTAWSSEKWYI